MKWSIYVSEVASGTFNALLKKDVNVDVTDASVTLTIYKENINNTASQ
jgi:hypothetical protein